LPLDPKLLPADKMTAIDLPDGGGEVHGANLDRSLRKSPIIIEVYAAKP